VFQRIPHGYGGGKIPQPQADRTAAMWPSIMKMEAAMSLRNIDQVLSESMTSQFRKQQLLRILRFGHRTCQIVSSYITPKDDALTLS
jgi:hypothetical protein